MTGPGVGAFEHGGLDGVLRAFVDERGGVDYAGLVQDAEKRGELRDYLDAVAKADLGTMGREEKLAFLVNAYNAATLELIVEHWPLKSIRDIPEDERWKAKRWVLAGETCSLDQIENDKLRKQFREPRIHFALVCAAKSCPPLRNEAYTAARLHDQLEAQARRVHGDPRWVRYEPGARQIELTPLYEWYAADFERVAVTVLDYVARYREDLAKDLAAGHRPEKRFLDYDWSLNGQEKER